MHNTWGLRQASAGLQELFATGSVRGQPIINIREILVRNGFTQRLTRNRRGYLFTNALGEQVRIMRRGVGWDIRVMNRFGNYLDEFGRVAPSPAAAHGIRVLSR